MQILSDTKVELLKNYSHHQGIEQPLKVLLIIR
jgi:hypothetical protein